MVITIDVSREHGLVDAPVRVRVTSRTDSGVYRSVTILDRVIDADDVDAQPVRATAYEGVGLALQMRSPLPAEDAPAPGGSLTVA